MRFSVWIGVLCSMGGIAGLGLVIAFSLTGWGEPGTAEYQTYELLNRLMAVALLFMAAGWVGAWPLLSGYGRWAAIIAFLGTFTIAIGTAAEFWLYSDLPYSGTSLRQTAFAVAGIGGIIQDIGAMVVGVSIRRSDVWPGWAAGVFMLAIPLDILAFSALGTNFLVSAVIALVLGWILRK